MSKPGLTLCKRICGPESWSKAHAGLTRNPTLWAHIRHRTARGAGLPHDPGPLPLFLTLHMPMLRGALLQDPAL